MIFEYLVRFFENTFASSGDAGAFVIVIFGFCGLALIGLIMSLIKKVKGFAFLGG